MLIYNQEKYKEFIDFLNKELPIDNDVKIKLLEGYDSIEVVQTGEKVFALYWVEKKTIYLPNKNDIEITYTNLAHEYIHAWQEDNNKEFDENEAQLKASELYNKFIN